jgi:type IV secretory pathway VirB9-like protein
MVMNENKFRKQSREESQTKIEDEAIKPYVIYFDGFSYTVVKPKEKGQDENLTYHTQLDGALKSVAKMLVNEQKTTTISDFLKRYDEIMVKISEKFKI